MIENLILERDLQNWFNTPTHFGSIPIRLEPFLGKNNVRLYITRTHLLVWEKFWTQMCVKLKGKIASRFLEILKFSSSDHR